MVTIYKTIFVATLANENSFCILDFLNYANVANEEFFFILKQGNRNKDFKLIKLSASVEINPMVKFSILNTLQKNPGFFARRVLQQPRYTG